MLDVARRTASDAERLEVESHLEGCAACREERATWMLVGALRDQEAPRLPQAAERRVLANLVAARGRVTGLAVARTRRPWLVRLAVPAAVLAAAAGVFVGRARVARPPEVAEGQRLDAAEPGAIAFAGAGVSYGAGTALTFHPATRTLELVRGEVDVDVHPDARQPSRFRVSTPRFVVEVLGTRFVVTSTGVRTLRGRVRVLDRAGHELAVVQAGEAWQGGGLPAPAATERAVRTASEAPAPRAVRTGAPARRASVPELLSRGRAALAAGDAALARGFIQRAFDAAPSEHETPAVELLQADALLVERRPDDALAAYRRVARRRARAPEGETAAFAVGQLLFERGSHAEAGGALSDYLARYPQGRFVREARERLAQIQSPR
jgi:ferric-dicitrate binding protein FerR (iron transport regulator)